MMRSPTILRIALLAGTAVATPYVTGQTLVRDFQITNELRPRGGYLGVGIADMDADRISRLKMPEERGVEVTNVEEGSPADTAGIKVGDVLLSYNGETILGAQQFVRLVRETPAARRVRLSVWRSGKEQPLLVTTAASHPSLPNADMYETFSNFNMPEMHFTMPDVPTIIMAWNSSSLGIECEPVDQQLAQFFGVRQGMLIRSVRKGTSGEKAGFKAGDVVTSVGNRPVKTPDDFHRILPSGVKQVPILVMRDHKALTLNVELTPDRE